MPLGLRLVCVFVYLSAEACRKYRTPSTALDGSSVFKLDHYRVRATGQRVILRTMRSLLAVASVCAISCGGSSTAPTPTPTPPAPAPIPMLATITGRVTATNGGQPLAGLQAALGATTTATTDAAGGFTMQTLPASTLRLQLTGSSIVPRTLMVAASASRAVALDAIALSGFDLTFYRQFVRNTLAAPNTMEPLRRWTRAPSIRVRTVDDAGRPMDAALVAMALRVAADAVPAWTGFQPASLESGPAARTGESWLTIGWADHVVAGRCGEAFVGGDTVLLFYLNANCTCGALALMPQTVRHELGHAFGFWHTDSVTDAMT